MSTSCGEKILSNDYSDWIIDFELTPELIEANTADMDYCYRQIDNQLGLVFVRREQMNPIGLLNYAYQHIPSVFGLQQEAVTISGQPFDPSPLINSGITQVQRQPLGLTGTGTIIAFLDTGIDYQNPVFLKSDGSSRILAIWDQTIQEGNPPEGFDYGTEYNREKINEALSSEQPLEIVPSQDRNGHGTAMASVAAGSPIAGEGAFIGAAPDTDIVVIKLKECKPYLREYYLLPEDVPAYQSTDIIMALEYADRFARAFYRPVIFCIGVGSSFGSHSGSSPLSTYLNRLGRKRSRVVVIGGGNEGNAAGHFEGILDPVGTRQLTGGGTPALGDQYSRQTGVNPTRQEIEIRVGEGERGFIAEIWGKAPNVFSLSIRSPGGEIVPNTGIKVDRGVEYQFVYERTEITVSYALVEGTTGDELITLRFAQPTAGIWTIILQNDRGLPGAQFHVWLPISQFLSSDTYFLQPNPNITMTIPSYTEEGITVASYSDRTNSIYVRSGRGFSRGSGIKPDIAAPAVDVSVALRGLPGELRLGRMTGSSMAAAITAGGIAQFMQWAITDKNANYLRSAEVKNYLIRGAVREETLNYPNRQWGDDGIIVSS